MIVIRESVVTNHPDIDFGWAIDLKPHYEELIETIRAGINKYIDNTSVIPKNIQVAVDQVADCLPHTIEIKLIT